jgi:hypothetical protein
MPVADAVTAWAGEIESREGDRAPVRCTSEPRSCGPFSEDPVDVTLASLFSFYSFSTGRRLFALLQVQKAAKSLKLGDVTKHVASAIKHDQKTHALEATWASQSAEPAAEGPGTRGLDAQVDRALTAIRDGAQAQIDGADPKKDKALVTRAEAMLTSLFPKGLAAVTGLPYVEELAAVDAIVRKLRGQHAPLVTELGLGRLVKRLAKLAGEYRAALEKEPEKGLSYAEVRAARAAGQENLLVAVAMIVGKFPSSSAADLEARGALLGPIVEQNEAIRAYLKARRAVEDVDPATGKVDPAAPKDAPAKDAPAKDAPAKEAKDAEAPKDTPAKDAPAKPS